MNGSFIYNGVKIGIEDPFVGINDEIILYGGKLAAIKRISVRGNIYNASTNNNCSQDVLQKISDFSKLFVEDYKPISIGSFSAQYARCESLSISNSSAFGAEYQAEFLAYPENWFRNTVGILDPIDSIRISKSKNNIVSIVRNISARGVTSDTLGISNVEEWIKSLNPENIENNNIINLLNNLTPSITLNKNIKPVRISHNVNRLDGSVNVTIEFNFNVGSTSKTILNTNCEISYDSKIGLYTVNINGSLNGGIGTTKDDLFSDFKKFNGFQFASSQLPLDKNIVLDPIPASSNIDYNETECSISFNYIYNNILIDKIIKSTTTLNYNVLDEIASISINGTIVKNKESQYKKNLNKNILFNNLNLKNVILSEFKSLQTDYLHNKIPDINMSFPKNSSISLNNSDYIGNFSVTYDNSFYKTPDLFLDDTIYDFQYNITYEPSIPIKKELQFIDGSKGLMNYKAKKRGSLSINGTALSKELNKKDMILNAAERIINKIKSEQSFDKEHLEKKSCTFFVDKDNTIQYSFEIVISATTTLFLNK